MLNKSAINKLLALPDDRMLTMLKIMMSGAGLNMSGQQIDEKTIRRIRALLTEVNDDDLERFTKLAECYRNGG